MCVLKRAFFYVSRKWQQSLVVFLVLLVVNVSALIGFAVLKASDTAAANLRRQLGGTFCMGINKDNPANWKSAEFGEQYSAKYYAGDFLDHAVIDEVMKVPGITEYGAGVEGVANLKSGDGGYYELVENKQNYFTSFNSRNPHTARIQGWTSLGQCSYFADHFLEVVQGEAFTGDGAGQALISRELAERNQIEIGDEITLEINREVVGFDVPAEKQQCTFEIVGIFDICGEQQINQYTLPRQMLQNWVFVDSRTFLPFLNEVAEQQIGYEEVRFSVDDPAELDSIVKSVQENEAINWDFFKITIEDTNYQSAENALKSMDGGIRVMIIVIAAVGAGVLVLLLSIWAKSRIYETGIFLSLGKSRGEILIQRTAEIMWIAVLALGVSWACSSAAANEAGNRLLAQTNQRNTEQAGENLSYADSSYDLTPVFSPPEVEELTVIMSADIIASVCFYELLIILFSVGMADVSVIRMKPKAILMKWE